MALLSTSRRQQLPNFQRDNLAPSLIRNINKAIAGIEVQPLPSDDRQRISLVQLALHCPKCGAQVEVARETTRDDANGAKPYTVYEIRDVVTDYLIGKEESCPNDDCRRKLDWWKIISLKIRSHDSPYFGFLLTGGQVTNIHFRLEPEEKFRLKFSDYGIPEGAVRLSLEYFICPTFPIPRFVYPLEDWSSGSGPVRKEIADIVWLTPVPNDADCFFGEEATPMNWMASLAWVPPHLSRAHAAIATAFFSLYENRLSDVPVSAQVAVEGTLREVLREILVQHVSRPNAEDLLVKALTFTHQLNALYPFIVGFGRLPPLPNEIRGMVNKLANTRNKIVHTLQEHSFSAEDAADGLTGSLFTLRHLLVTVATSASCGV